MIFKLFGFKIEITREVKLQAVVPTGEKTEASVFERMTMAPKKRAVYNPAKDINRLREGKEFTYFKKGR